MQKKELKKYIIGRTGYRKKQKVANFTNDYNENSRKRVHESKIAEEDFFQDVDVAARKAKTFTENSPSFLRAKENGVTLTMLVIIVVILLILSTVTINVVLGDGGLIQTAQAQKNRTEGTIGSEEEDVNRVMQEYANVMAEDSEFTPPTPGKPEEPEDPGYVDSVLPSAPKLSDGMTPVKWNGNYWIRTTADDSEWYDYANKEWANVVLGDATFRGDTLDENQPYSMLVWIPRYAYQITSQYHQSGTGAGNINIVFVGTDNKSKDGTQYSETYPSYSTGSGMTDYVVHPAFDYGDSKVGIHKLSGFWVGKFETSNTRVYYYCKHRNSKLYR